MKISFISESTAPRLTFPIEKINWHSWIAQFIDFLRIKCKIEWVKLNFLLLLTFHFSLRPCCVPRLYFFAVIFRLHNSSFSYLSCFSFIFAVRHFSTHTWLLSVYETCINFLDGEHELFPQCSAKVPEWRRTRKIDNTCWMFFMNEKCKWAIFFQSYVDVDGISRESHEDN